MQWTVAFASVAGSVQLLTMDTSQIRKLTSGATLSVASVTSLVAGFTPGLGSALYGSTTLASPLPYTIEGLRTGAQYHVRVAAYNGVGRIPGSPRAASSLAVTVAQQSSPPQSVEVAPASNTTLRITWAAPSDTGGAPVLKHRVEWDGAAGVPEVQLVTQIGGASGSFKLSMGGAATSPLPFDADATRSVKLSVAVLA